MSEPTFADDCMTYRGALLAGRYAHSCWEWDGLPVDETCSEWPCCSVAYRTLPRKLKKLAEAHWSTAFWLQRSGSRRYRHFSSRLYRAKPSRWKVFECNKRKGDAVL